MRSLLDINVLIALLDPDHSFHARAHDWWRKEKPTWASCPITENGLLRIMASTSYSKARPFTVAELSTQFQLFVSQTKHFFWPDSLSLRDQTQFKHQSILSSKHLTDLYLLALAVENGGRLVTFNQGIPLSVVIRAKPKNLLVL